MPTIAKKKNHQSEEHFHDEWALSVDVKEVDVVAQFEGITSPEYAYAMKQLGRMKGKKILNLGSGIGEETVYLAKQKAQVTAIDISKQMLEVTKRLAKQNRIRQKITYKHANAEKLPFKDNTFDAVLGCNLLHHVNLKKCIKESKRVLKPGGIAVYSEPLIYNPIINVYRKMAHKVRTDGEHPLDMKDLEIIRKEFPAMIHKEFHLTTLLIFVWFYLAERKHPNQVRYWKKIITEADTYRMPFKILQGVDTVLLTLLPFIKRYCWVTVIKVQK